jgi:hypothetical protein
LQAVPKYGDPELAENTAVQANIDYIAVWKLDCEGATTYDTEKFDGRVLPKTPNNYCTKARPYSSFCISDAWYGAHCFGGQCNFLCPRSY